MNKEILEAYQSLKITNPAEVKNLTDLNVEINRVKDSWRELIKKYNPDNGKVRSEELTKRINLSKETLENYFQELKQELSEQAQEIEIKEKSSEIYQAENDKEKSETVYPKHDETVRDWKPENFEKKKALENYEDKTGFKKGFGFDKRV